MRKAHICSKIVNTLKSGLENSERVIWPVCVCALFFFGRGNKCSGVMSSPVHLCLRPDAEDDMPIT